MLYLVDGVQGMTSLISQTLEPYLTLGSLLSEIQSHLLPLA